MPSVNARLGVLSNLNFVNVQFLLVVNAYLSIILNLPDVKFPELSTVQLVPSVLYSTVTKSPDLKFASLSLLPSA